MPDAGRGGCKRLYAENVGVSNGNDIASVRNFVFVEAWKSGCYFCRTVYTETWRLFSALFTQADSKKRTKREVIMCY